jgi:hypothetical protein
MMDAMGNFIEKFAKEGALVDTGGLAASRQVFRMRLAKESSPPRMALHRQQGDHRRVGNPQGGFHGRDSPPHYRVPGAAPKVLARPEGECEVRPIAFLASDARGAL